MRISSVKIQNYRSLKQVELPINELTILIGRNDVGKSNIIYALEMFFSEEQPDDRDFCKECAQQDPIEIEVTFEIVEDDKKLKLRDMRFLSKDERLVVLKIFKRKTRKPEIALKAYDFLDPDFQNLRSKKERELNDTGAKYNLSFVRSGRSITNESKIKELLQHAANQSLPQADIYITPDDDSGKMVEELLPSLRMFPSELNLSIDKAEFQNPFQVLIEDAVGESQESWEEVRKKVQDKVDLEIRKIEQHLLAQTDAVTGIVPHLDFQWRRMVTVRLDTQDESGMTIPLENRGMGVRRLVMVAFLRYLAEKSLEKEPERPRIFGIEEPETSLHPSAQRVLIDSLHTLRNAGYQIIMTTHSPTFAAEAKQEEVVLVKREGGQTLVVTKPQLTAEDIVDELGIEPRDQLASFNACVFVEGRGDEVFFSSIAKTLKAHGTIKSDFVDKNIGLISVGGNNLKFFVEGNLLRRINKNFAVVVDSNKKSPNDTLRSEYSIWKKQCESSGGKFYILQKREIENYLHPSAIHRVTGKKISFSDYDDVKKLISPDYSWKPHLEPIVTSMSAKEILDMDRYVDDNKNVRNELVEIIQELLSLC